MGYGQTICREATEMAIARAKDKGAAIVGLRRTHHMGRIGAWGEMCARAGLISIHYVTTTGPRPYVAPWGGIEARYSTNPYCKATKAPDQTPLHHYQQTAPRGTTGTGQAASD